MCLTAALEVLYAGLAPPGGFVIPCFEPVRTIDLGDLSDEELIRGSIAARPFRNP